MEFNSIETNGPLGKFHLLFSISFYFFFLLNFPDQFALALSSRTTRHWSVTTSERSGGGAAAGTSPARAFGPPIETGRAPEERGSDGESVLRVLKTRIRYLRPWMGALPARFGHGWELQGEGDTREERGLLQAAATRGENAAALQLSSTHGAHGVLGVAMLEQPASGKKVRSGLIQWVWRIRKGHTCPFTRDRK